MVIGGAGHSSDAMAIWICQFVGREIRLLDYIEGVGQPLAYYAGELRRRGWKDAVICLPHDGVATNNITGKRYIDHWREAGFECVQFYSHAKNAEDDPLQQLFRLLFCQRQTKVPAVGRSWQSRASPEADRHTTRVGQSSAWFSIRQTSRWR